MVKKRGRYENVGATQSIFTVNFRNPGEIMAILQTFKGNNVMEGHLVDLYCKMQDLLTDYEFSKLEQKQLLKFAVDAIENGENGVDILLTASNLLKKLAPGEEENNNEVINSFLSFFLSLPKEAQTGVYEALGNDLNKVLYEETKPKTEIQKIDLEKLLKTTSKSLYEVADQRLKSFIDAAVKTDERGDRNDENRNRKREVFCSNIIENFLKARNLKYVSLSGLAVLTLVYILSGRSKQTCNLFSSTGAKGSYRLVTEYVLPNSKNTSYKHCQDNVTVFYSFDNAQKLFKTWRLHGSSNDKSLAMVTTSIVHCYPDGLLTSDVQYVLRGAFKSKKR